jgi:hypothetical protein
LVDVYMTMPIKNNWIGVGSHNGVGASPGTLISVSTAYTFAGNIVTRSSVRHIPISLLLCTDGLASYPKQALKVFSEPLRTGKGVLDSFCQKVSWLPKRSSAKLGDR